MALQSTEKIGLDDCSIDIVDSISLSKNRKCYLPNAKEIIPQKAVPADAILSL